LKKRGRLRERRGVARAVSTDVQNWPLHCLGRGCLR
jgi:hypothetical protein